MNNRPVFFVVLLVITVMSAYFTSCFSGNKGTSLALSMPNIQVFPGEDIDINFHGARAKFLTLRVCRVEPVKYYSTLLKGEMPPSISETSGQVVFSKKLSAGNGKLSGKTRFNLKRPGLYIIEVCGQNGKSSARKWLVVSGLALLVKSSPGRLLAWVVAPDESKPVKDCKIIVQDNKSKILAKGLTGKNGLFNIDVKRTRVYLILAEKDGHIAVGSAWPQGDVEKTRVYFRVRNKTVKPGDKINFLAVVYSRFSGRYEPAAGVPFKIYLEDRHGNIIARENVKTGPGGFLKGDMMVPGHTKSGFGIIRAGIPGARQEVIPVHIEESGQSQSGIKPVPESRQTRLMASALKMRYLK